MYQDIINKILSNQQSVPGTSSAYGNEVPRYDPLTMAPDLVKAIVAAQTEQRSKPITEALQGFGKQYYTAGTAEEQQAANNMANTARSLYLQSGRSPMDLPQNLWGSSPTQGFQTGADTFEVPVTGMEGLSDSQRANQLAVKRQALLDELGIRKDVAGITGYDPNTNMPTLDYLYKMGSLANAAAKAGSSGGITPYQQRSLDRSDQKDMASIYSDARKLADNAVQKGRIPAGVWDYNDLVRSYIDTGYSEANAIKAADADPRNIYNHYYQQLTREQYALPTANPR